MMSYGPRLRSTAAALPPHDFQTDARRIPTIRQPCDFGGQVA